MQIHNYVEEQYTVYYNILQYTTISSTSAVYYNLFNWNDIARWLHIVKIIVGIKHHAGIDIAGKQGSGLIKLVFS